MATSVSRKIARWIGRWQVRLAVLLVLSITATVVAVTMAHRASASYDAELERLANPSYKASIDSRSRESRAETLRRMSEESGQLLQLAVLLLGAVAALVTTNKVHRISSIETVYVLLAPASLLLVGSVYQWIRFHRSVTFLQFKDSLHPSPLIGYLQCQSELLFLGLACLFAFVMIFYLLIVFGGARPTEDA